MKKQITKSYLEYLGVTSVTKDGRVFTKNGERKPSLRGRSKNNPSKQEKLEIQFHNPEKCKSDSKDSSRKVHIYLHHIVFAWFNNEVPYGKEIHHKDMNYLNNSLDNLVAMDPKEHRALHAAARVATREVKCRLNVPRTYYETKLKKFMELYKEAKANNDMEKANQARSAADHTKARLRYYDSHIEEAQKLTEFKKDLMELEAWKKTFKENGNLKNWHECCTIEKLVKELDIEAWSIVKHALEVAHKYFGKED